MFKHILVPTDGSASADIAVQSCMRFAKAIGAKVTGIHVVAPPADPDVPANDADDYLLSVQQNAREQGVPCDVVVAKSDDVQQAILQTAFDRQCDLIAIAPHGRKGVRDRSLGSSTHEILARSQIPVLVFR